MQPNRSSPCQPRSENTFFAEGVSEMKIIKRNGSEVSFDLSKIVNAIAAANKEVPSDERLKEREIKFAALNVEDQCREAGHTVTE